MTNTGRGRGPAGEAPADDLLAKLGAAGRAEQSELSDLPPAFASELGAAERNAMAQSALAMLGPARPAVAVAPRRRRWLWPGLVIPLAAACALVLVLRPRPGPAPLPLPDYDITATGGLRQTRGPEPDQRSNPAQAALQRVAAGTELVVVARPAVDVQGEIAVRAFVVRGEAVREASARVQFAPSGSVELRVRPADGMQGPPGAASLRIIVGRPAAVRGATQSEALRAPAGGPEARWLIVPLELLGG
jgi:hypothetical protein